VLTLTGLLPWLKALTCPDSGLLLLVGDSIRQLVLFERTFGWMDVSLPQDFHTTTHIHIPYTGSPQI
jgi:hypothetical protein